MSATGGNMFQRLALLLIATQLAVVAGPGWAADAETRYPNRPVRLITGSTGGASDHIARLVAQRLSERWHQQVVVDNRSGRAGIMGSEIVAKSVPDGYTLAVGLAGTHAAPQFLYKSLAYDPVKDFAPVTLLSSTGIALVVHTSVPVRDAAEFVAYARSKSGGVNYASAGTGTTSQLAAELFNQMTRATLVHVPYRAAGLALNAVIGNETQSGFVAVSSATPHVAAGRLRALAVLSDKRLQAAPQIPSTVEAGLPAVNASVWTGLFAPARTPKPIINAIHREVVAILALPETRDALTATGAEPMPTTPEAFARFLDAEIIKWGKVIKTAGLKAE